LREERPRSDVATIVSTLIAILALAWSVYAYYYPRPAPDPNAYHPAPASDPNAKPSAYASASATARPSATPSGDSQKVEQPSSWYSEFKRDVERWSQGTVAFAKRFWQRAQERSERDRHDRSWWALTLIWIAIMLTVSVTLSEEPLPLVSIPLVDALYIYYFWPSLAWWGVIICIVAGVLWTFAAKELQEIISTS